MLRHPLSLERLSLTQDGRIAYAVKYPRSPTRTHLLLDGLSFMARIASLIPPPRHPLVRYFGVLSSASRWRPHVVLVPREANGSSAEQVRNDNASRAPTASPAPTKSSGMNQSKLALVSVQPAPNSGEAKQPDEPAWRGCVTAATRYIPWQELLKRVHDIDALRCVRCGGRLEFIAVILDETAAHDILVSLGLPADKPEVARARAPTLWDDEVPAIDVA